MAFRRPNSGLVNRHRGESRLTAQESRLMLNQAIATGRGGVFLSLTAAQYATLNTA